MGEYWAVIKLRLGLGRAGKGRQQAFLWPGVGRWQGAVKRKRRTALSLHLTTHLFPNGGVVGDPQAAENKIDSGAGRKGLHLLLQSHHVTNKAALSDVQAIFEQLNRAQADPLVQLLQFLQIQ